MSPRRLAAGLATAVLAAACQTAGPDGSAQPPGSSGTPGSFPSPSASARAALFEPGRPFDAADVLAAMRASRRPGGVPAEIRTEEVAAAVADEIWTIDGAPWQAMTVGGSCGPEACMLEVSGAAAGAVGEDVWVFRVDADSADVAVEAADLHSVPERLAAELDGIARSLAPDAVADVSMLTAVRWSPPPAEDLFTLSYRAGDEEGSCAVEVELDAAAPALREVESTDC